MELTNDMIEAYAAGASLRQCGERFGVDRKELRSALVAAGVHVRSKGEIVAAQFAGSPWRDEPTMRDLYEQQRLSTIEIASRLGCDKSVAVDWLNRFGVTMRTTAETQKGREPPTKGKGKRNSAETVLCGCGCGQRIKRFNFGSGEVRFARGHRVSGAAHPRYRPLSPNQKPRHEAADYRQWRKVVLKASDYTCSECGQRGGKLHSHHVMPVATHARVMFEPWNGKAMCKPCHTQVHKAAREVL